MGTTSSRASKLWTKTLTLQAFFLPFGDALELYSEPARQAPITHFFLVADMPVGAVAAWQTAACRFKLRESKRFPRNKKRPGPCGARSCLLQISDREKNSTRHEDSQSGRHGLDALREARNLTTRGLLVHHALLRGAHEQGLRSLQGGFCLGAIARCDRFFD